MRPLPRPTWLPRMPPTTAPPIAPIPLPWPFDSTARIDSTTPQSAQAAPVDDIARWRLALDLAAGADFAAGSVFDSTFGSQPIIVAMPATLKTITAIAAISIRG